MDSEIFENWLRESAPFMLEEAGQRKIVLILDNAPYHSRKKFKVPTKSSSKQEMINFLESHGNHTPAGLRKPEVYEYLKEIVRNKPELEGLRAVEEICHSFGIEVTFEKSLV